MVQWRGDGSSCLLCLLDAQKQEASTTDKGVTLAVPSCMVKPGGHAYYELKLQSLERDAVVEVGWATLAMEQSKDDKDWKMGSQLGSWSVNGLHEVRLLFCAHVQSVQHLGFCHADHLLRSSQVKSSNRVAIPYRCRWQEGDVIGVAVDLRGNGRMAVFLNGRCDSPNGIVFDALLPEEQAWQAEHLIEGVFPAFALKGIMTSRP